MSSDVSVPSTCGINAPPDEEEPCPQCLDHGIIANMDSADCRRVQLQESCHACGKLGCWRTKRSCAFVGRPKIYNDAEPIVVPVSFCQGLHGVSVRIHDCDLAIGTASGAGCNCLIDATYQLLRAHWKQVLIPDACSLREALMKAFSDKVRSHVTADSFLDFREHLPFILDFINRYNHDQQLENPCNVTLEHLRARCVSQDLGIVGDDLGTGEITIHYLNSNQQHFVPLFVRNANQNGKASRSHASDTSGFHGYPRLHNDLVDQGPSAKEDLQDAGNGDEHRSTRQPHLRSDQAEEQNTCRLGDEEVPRKTRRPKKRNSNLCSLAFSQGSSGNQKTSCAQGCCPEGNRLEEPVRSQAEEYEIKSTSWKTSQEQSADVEDTSSQIRATKTNQTSQMRIQEVPSPSSTDMDCESSLDESEPDTCPLYMRVKYDNTIDGIPCVATEQDAREYVVGVLSKFLRKRPCIPAARCNSFLPTKDIKKGINWALHVCPFKACVWQSDDENDFRKHVASRSSVHAKDINEAAKGLNDVLGVKLHDPEIRLAFVMEACAVIDRNDFPYVGLSRTRVALRAALQKFNDRSLKNLMCFSCGCIHTTRTEKRFEADANQNTDATLNSAPLANCSGGWLMTTEVSHPGTLLNHLSYDLWRARYGSTGPLARFGPGCLEGDDFDTWVVAMKLLGTQVRLFGNPEDISCDDDGCDFGGAADSYKSKRKKSSNRTLCNKCSIPFCRKCRIGLSIYRGYHEIPMAIANDNWYGFVLKILADPELTWIEVAAANLIFSTIMVYYLEEPHGHLMGEKMSGAIARTKARGNLFSFQMNWMDVAEQCRDAIRQDVITPLPHDEHVLSNLVSAQFTSGVSNLADHLPELKLRPHVVVYLIGVLRERGWEAYAKYTPSMVKDRAAKIYGKSNYTTKQWREGFVPAAILAKVKTSSDAAPQKPSDSLIAEKSTLPADPPAPVTSVFKSMRPLEIVGEKSGLTCSESHEFQENNLSKIVISTSTTMVPQFNPQYLGVANPFTINFACGMFDMPKQDVWRRWSERKMPETKQVPLSMLSWPHLSQYPQASRQALLKWIPFRHLKTDRSLRKKSPPQVAASELSQAEFTQMCARRSEGQFKRHWNWMPSAWNMTFGLFANYL